MLNKRTALVDFKEKLKFENIFTNQDAQALHYSGLMYVLFQYSYQFNFLNFLSIIFFYALRINN